MARHGAVGCTSFEQRARGGVPRLGRFWGGVAALGLAVAAQSALNRRLGLDALILGSAGLAWWLWLYGAPRMAARKWIRSDARGWARRWLGAGLLAGAAGVAMWRVSVLDVYVVTHQDWYWYGASVALGLAGVAAMERWPTQRLLRAQRRHWRTWAFLLGFAAALRLWRLDGIPYGTWYDEAANGLEALRVLREPGYQPIYTDGVNATGHYLWLLAGSLRLWGETTFALRVVSALMGIATVAAAYGAGREIYGRAMGLAVAGVMATAHWALTFSRLGMYNSATPLAELATLWFLARGLRRNSPLDFGLAGLALGLGLCFYSAFQLFVGVVTLLLAGLAWRERAQWRQLAQGLALTALVTWLVIAPVVKYALVEPELYFARVQNTSLLRDGRSFVSSPALWENARKHLLMFNVWGDPNGRHNLPGAPVLDMLSGALLVLGLVTCLRRANRPELAILPVWAVAGLLGGILSLGFEAPQSLRSIAAQPAIFLMVALPLGELAQEWRTGGGRNLPNGAVWVVLLGLLPIAVLNVDRYFTRQTSDFATWNAHSTAETMSASVLRELNGAEAYVISLYDHHPTIRFLAPGAQYVRLETNASLPLLRPPDRDRVLILDTERGDLFKEAQRVYPQAEFEEWRAPFGGPVVLYLGRISTAAQASVQGLMATYLREGEDAPHAMRQEQSLDLQWPDDAPLELPFSAEWSGVLAVDTYGPHQFMVEAPGEAALYVGEEAVLHGDARREGGLNGALVLARGLHNVRLRAEGGEGRVVLAWRTPAGEPGVVPPWMLYVPPVGSNGLLGRYYANEQWEGQASFAQIDPKVGMYFHVPVLPRPYSVTWTGKLAIPEDGRYGFALESIDESSLLIDGEEVAASRQRAERGTGEVRLTRGLHDIEVRYVDRTDHTFINLYWQPSELAAAGGYQIIPSDFLFPPQRDYTRIEMPALHLPPRNTASNGALDDGDVAPAVVTAVLEGLAAPRGLAYAEGQVFVAESGAGRVFALDVESGTMRELTPAGQRFVEPVDIAVDSAGQVFVLDAGAARIEQFAAEGEYVSTITAPPDLLNRARGLDVDSQGRLWVASTPAQRMVAFDLGGALVGEIVRPAVSDAMQAMQPVDVLALDDGSLYATDAGNHRLLWFSAASTLLQSYALPVANSVDGSHLARDGAGHVYVSEPEAGRVVQLDSQGQVSAVWTVRTPGMPDVKPVGLAVDEHGTVWVADVQGGRVLQVLPEVP